MHHPDDDCASFITPADVTGLVLAGGRGSRMGGVDKGLQTLDGMPLALLAVLRLQLQVGSIMVNANRNLQAYEGIGAPLVVDATSDFPGPLAGVAAGLRECQTPWLVSVPCDTPEFPPDLVGRMVDAAQGREVDVVVAATREAPIGSDAEPDAPPDRAAESSPAAPPAGPRPKGVRSSRADGLRWQPVFMLVHIRALPSLEAFLASGERKIDRWIEQQRHAVAVFDDASAFDNLNTTDELHARQRRRNERAQQAERERAAEQAARDAAR